jgi:opacity protein-like surface antigen
MTDACAATKGIALKTGCNPAVVLVPLLVALLAMPVRVSAADSMAVSQELDIALGYVGRAATLQDNLHVGSLSELNSDVKYVVSPQLNKDLLLRFGAEWQRFSFGTARTAAAPDTLQQASAILGFDYQLADQWLMRAEVQPGMYGDFRQFSWRSFDAPFVLGFAYLMDADLQWFFGLRVDVRSQYPVFPAVGVRWKFADVWTLNLQLPNPRLEYDLNDKLQTYLGAGIMAGTYMVGDHFGDDRGLPQLNHATVDYIEVRLGPGLSWKALPNLTLEAEGGYVLSRTWDFFDQHINLSSRPVPFLQLAGHARF